MFDFLRYPFMLRNNIVQLNACTLNTVSREAIFPTTDYFAGNKNPFVADAKNKKED